MGGRPVVSELAPVKCAADGGAPRKARALGCGAGGSGTRDTVSGWGGWRYSM